MTTVLLVVHAFIALALVVTVLLQRSEGGALGIGGGGMSGFLTGRATANMLTRATAILAALFFVTSITLAIIAGQGGKSRSIIDDQPAGGTTAPLPSGLPTTLPATGPIGVPGAAPVAPAAGDQGPAAPSR